MTEHGQTRGIVVIVGSFLIATLLTIMPLPDWARPFRPPWTSLVLIFWCIALPQRVGVGSGFLVGLLLDVITGTVLGQQASVLSLTAFVANQLSRRIAVFPIWQQAVFVFLLLAIQNLLNTWILGATGNQRPDFQAWLMPFFGALLWPWIYIMLRDFRQRMVS